MRDRRLTPANRRVAAAHLHGLVSAPRYSEGAAGYVTAPVADLLRDPDGARDRQLLHGAAVTVYDKHDGWAFVQAARDGYVGYLPEGAVGDMPAPDHAVAVRSTHLYPAPDFKAHEICTLPNMARLNVIASEGRFAKTPQGFVPAAHLAPLNALAIDPVAIAALYLGTPYLWGGNSSFGIDCSGLVQAGCLACGIACPGDSDMQEAELGEALPEGVPLQRGDLLFRKGHVAWVADPKTLLHANAHHMAVAYEPIDAAINRIADQGDGPVTARKRLGGLT